MRIPPPVAPRLLSLLGVAVLAAPALARADSLDGWEPGRRAEGDGFAYQVYSRRDEGEGYVRYRVRGTIRTRAERLPASVRVIASDPDWVPDGQARRVLVNEPGEFVVYTRIDLPPLFSDRDVVSRGVMSVGPGGVHRIEWRAVEHEMAPPVEGVVRIERGAGSWQFTPGDAARTDVDYETFIDLGGSLPGWLIGPLMAGNVSKNFEDVARHALRVETAAAN